MQNRRTDVTKTKTLSQPIYCGFAEAECIFALFIKHSEQEDLCMIEINRFQNTVSVRELNAVMRRAASV